MIKIEINKKAGRELRKLTKKNSQLKKQLYDSILSIQENPEDGLMKYLPPKLQGIIHKKRSGDYRIIYAYKENKIIILSVFHRKEEYDRIKKMLKTLEF
ncbi:MAG: type II toxin-antitoxin system RelE/ParE family toxin [Methanosarcinales archaeon]